MIRVATIVLIVAGALLLIANYTVLQCGCKAVMNPDGSSVTDKDGRPVLVPNPYYAVHQRAQNLRTVAALVLIAAGLILPWAAGALSERRTRGEEPGAPQDTGGTPHDG